MTTTGFEDGKRPEQSDERLEGLEQRGPKGPSAMDPLDRKRGSTTFTMHGAFNINNSRVIRFHTLLLSLSPGIS